VAGQNRFGNPRAWEGVKAGPFRLFLVGATVGSGVFAAAAPVEAQVEVKSRAVELTITGRVHTQFNSTSVSGEPASEFLLRRARLTAEIKVNDFVSGKIQPDYGEGKLSLKDAYVRLTFAPAFRATLGQFKRPFDVFELTSSTEIVVVERAGGVNGVDTCPGPGGICSFSRFTEKLQYSDRDIGVMLDGRSKDGRVSYMAAITNGTGANTTDENGTRSYSGRVAFEPLADVVVAGNVGVHDYVDPATGNEYAVAYGGDVEIGNFSRGFHMQAGLTVGDNWQHLVGGQPSTFVTGQGIVTYKVPIADNRFLAAVEPVGRVSWGDPNSDAIDDEGWLITPGLVFHFTGRNKIGANVDIWTPAAGDTEWSVKIQSYLHF